MASRAILLGTSNRHFESQRLLWHYVPHVRIAAILYRLGYKTSGKKRFQGELASRALVLLGTSNRHFDSQCLLWHYVPHVRIAAILYRLGYKTSGKKRFQGELASRALILLGTSNRLFDSQCLLWHYVPHVRIAAILYRLGVQDLRKKVVFKAKLASRALILLGTSNRHFDSLCLLWHYVPHVRIAAILYRHVGQDLRKKSFSRRNWSRRL